MEDWEDKKMKKTTEEKLRDLLTASGIHPDQVENIVSTIPIPPKDWNDAEIRCKKLALALDGEIMQNA